MLPRAAAAPNALLVNISARHCHLTQAAVEALKADYDTRPGLTWVEVAGGHQIVTRPELHEWVRRLFHERSTQKLTVQALETLAVRGVPIRELVEVREVLGPAEVRREIGRAHV